MQESDRNIFATSSVNVILSVVCMVRLVIGMIKVCALSIFALLFYELS